MIIRIFSAIGLGLMMSAVWASYAAGSITADMRNQTENLANVKKDLGAQIASVKQDFTAQLANVKQDLHDQIGRADTNVNLRIDQLEKRMDRRDKEIDRRFDLLELKLEMILGKLPAPKPAALDVPK